MSRVETRKPFAKKSLGQNFLIDPNYIQKIVDALKIESNETVIEIGPGRGALTERLVDTTSNVIALELDRNLVPVLREKFALRSNLQVIETDALGFDFATLVSGDQKLKLVANLPYYISTAILQRLIEQRNAFSAMVLMFQREVVDRITAAPGDSERGFLTVLAEAYLQVNRLFDVPPSAFRPIPKVWSSVVHITPKAISIQSEEAFRGLVSRSFLQKRKTILNNLKNHYPNAAETLATSSLDPKRRPETLSLEDWLRLADVVERPSSDAKNG